MTLPLDTTRDATLPAVLRFAVRNADGSPASLTGLSAEFGARGIDRRPCTVAAPGVWTCTLTAAEVPRLHGVPADLRVGSATVPSSAWWTGRISVAVREADGTPLVDTAQTVEVQFTVPATGPVVVGSVVVYRGLPGTNGTGTPGADAVLRDAAGASLGPLAAVKLTQAQYDAIPTKLPGTLYLIA